VQFACQKHPVKFAHETNDTSAPQASPVVTATPVQLPRSTHPAAREQSAPESPEQEIGVPLQVPVATTKPGLFLLFAGRPHANAASSTIEPATNDAFRM
jgi:hypothetical protein